MKNTNSSIFIALGVVLIIILVSGSFKLVNNIRQIPSNNMSKIEDNKTNQNAQLNENNSSTVPKGTFRNTETGEIFDYIDGRGYLVSCGLSNCKTAYFDMADDGNIIQIRNTEENPTIGRITNVTEGSVDSDYVNYDIEYIQHNSEISTNYYHTLCRNIKGGGKNCMTPARVGQTVILDFMENSQTTVENLTIFNHMLKTDVLNVVSVSHDELINQK
jgi:hypothetical protein